MKYFLLILVVLLGSMLCFGQRVGSINSEAQPIHMLDHPRHADYTVLKSELSLLGNNTTGTEHGEQLMWEAQGQKPRYERPLGDIAREIRKEHALAEKARVIWVN